jgi:hypothetical protein
MDCYNNGIGEPLNLCTKKKKPVAVVPPSSAAVTQHVTHLTGAKQQQQQQQNDVVDYDYQLLQLQTQASENSNHSSDDANANARIKHEETVGGHMDEQQQQQQFALFQSQTSAAAKMIAFGGADAMDSFNLLATSSLLNHHRANSSHANNTQDETDDAEQSDDNKMSAANSSLLPSYFLGSFHEHQQSLDAAKAHLERYLKLTNQYLQRTTPFLMSSSNNTESDDGSPSPLGNALSTDVKSPFLLPSMSPSSAANDKSVLGQQRHLNNLIHTNILTNKIATNNLITIINKLLEQNLMSECYFNHMNLFAQQQQQQQQHQQPSPNNGGGNQKQAKKSSGKDRERKNSINNNSKTVLNNNNNNNSNSINNIEKDDSNYLSNGASVGMTPNYDLANSLSLFLSSQQQLQQDSVATRTYGGSVISVRGTKGDSGVGSAKRDDSNKFCDKTKLQGCLDLTERY